MAPINVTHTGAVTITIDGSGRTVTLSEAGTLITGVTLKLKNITLQGQGINETNTAVLIRVNAGGTLELDDGIIITGNRTFSYSSVYGGGVYVGGGTFTMSGGAISGNTASSYDGGVYIYGGIFIKKDGTIYGDTDSILGNGNETDNTALSGNGHAVGLKDSTRWRNFTAGPVVKLYARKDGDTWIFNDISTGGVGDTTGNWE
jgi:hypothetical protein